MRRRTFLQTLAASGAALGLTPRDLLGENLGPRYFDAHPFIRANPAAVFIMRTNVGLKTDAAAVKATGLAFARTVFVTMRSPGFHVGDRVVIKPNIVMMPVKDERDMGIVTDPNFVEGVIEGLKLLGFRGERIHLREVNNPEHFENSGYRAMADRTGVDLAALSQPVGSLPKEAVQWVEVPAGAWFTKIPYLWPVNAPETFLINIAKFKSHLMGMSLCAKNLQGTIAIPYVRHCYHYIYNMGTAPEHTQPNAIAHIQESYRRHLLAGVPRWDRPGDDGGEWMETWAARCMDNNSVTAAGLHVIEAVYGREGPFQGGPDPDGRGVDIMTNMIIFGKNPFHVDNVGLWLSGHEPGNFGYLHIARERGLSTMLNPHEIPLFEWKENGTATPATLSSFQRFAIRTQYLCRDYNKQEEPEWHLVNEPFDYGSGTVAGRNKEKSLPVRLDQNFPNPFNPMTSISFTLPESGLVRLEVFDALGQTVGVLADEWRSQGRHLVAWNAAKCPSGIYFYRLLFNGQVTTKSMLLVR